MLFNVLETALSLLPAVVWEYRTLVGKQRDEFGNIVPQYSEWKRCRGMAQPVQASHSPNIGMYQAQKRYSFWGSVHLNGMDVQDFPDQIRFRGRNFNVEQDTDWTPYNGWHGCVAVEDKRERAENAANAGKPRIDDPDAQSAVTPPSKDQTVPTPVADWS